MVEFAMARRPLCALGTGRESDRTLLKCNLRGNKSPTMTPTQPDKIVIDYWEEKKEKDDARRKVEACFFCLPWIIEPRFDYDWHRVRLGSIPAGPTG